MRKRLLLVDDEAMVLDGLRRSWHGMRCEREPGQEESGAGNRGMRREKRQ